MNLVSARRARGFTLIELMVVVVIATILLGIAVPSYMSQLRQSRRTEAKSALLDLAGREERYFSTAANVAGPAYSSTASDLGYSGFGAATPIGNGYYYIQVCAPATGNCVAGLNMPNPPAAPSYTLVAVPVATKSQANDTQCGTLAVDSVGQQWSTGTSGAQYCWSN